MKTTISNEKTPKCKTCNYYTGTCCLLHEHVEAPIVFDRDFCGEHSDFEENKTIPHAEVVESITPFTPGWQAEQRKAFAKWYNNK